MNPYHSLELMEPVSESTTFIYDELAIFPFREVPSNRVFAAFELDPDDRERSLGVVSAVVTAFGPSALAGSIDLIFDDSVPSRWCQGRRRSRLSEPTRFESAAQEFSNYWGSGFWLRDEVVLRVFREDGGASIAPAADGFVLLAAAWGKSIPILRQLA